MSKSTAGIFLALCVIASTTIAKPDKPRENRAAPPHLPSFDEIDINHDGKISAEEFKNAQSKISQARFAHLDANDDGSLNADELEGIRKQIVERHPELADKPRKHAPLMSVVDADANEVVSLDEFADYSMKTAMDRFAKIDTDANGVITRDELDAAFDEIRAAQENKAARKDKHSGKPGRDAKPAN